MVVVYTVLALLIACLGTISGVGGGVILKPVMDALGGFDVLTISILVSATVFSMTFVSLVRAVIQRKNSETRVDFLKVAVLGISAVGGGIAGEFLLEFLAGRFSDSVIKLTQNIMLGLLVIGVLLYNNLKHPPRYAFKHIFVYFLAGLGLGVVSVVFRGPVNVVFLMLLFGMEIKKAVLYSLIITVFSQGATLLTAAFTTGFAGYDLSLLPYLIAGAIAGAVSGILIGIKLHDKIVKILFNVMQSLVFCTVIYNIVVLAFSAQ